uniref:Uncharacterized protein n=1 Tax=Malurus cyaneus samueli TaxID=2593467 RepID=A0A8C5X1X9_9PASS
PNWQFWRTLIPPSGESQQKEGSGGGRRQRGRAQMAGGPAVMGVSICCLRILHIYAAKGLRAPALAAAERMKALRRLDAREHRGKTPLLVAVTARQPAIVHDLIQAGADVNAVDNKGQSALHLAATYGYGRDRRWLLRFGVFLALSSPHPINFPGHTPLHCAVLAHNALLRDQSSQTLGQEQQEQLQQQILIFFAPFFKQDVKSNKTVLHYTVQDGNISLLRYFLELNAFKSKDFVNNKAHGNTALHMAAALPGDKNQREMIQLLLEHGPITWPPWKSWGSGVRHLLKKGKVAPALISCRRNARS